MKFTQGIHLEVESFLIFLRKIGRGGIRLAASQINAICNPELGLSCCCDGVNIEIRQADQTLGPTEETFHAISLNVVCGK
jgi:hypothetical protein